MEKTDNSAIGLTSEAACVLVSIFDSANPEVARAIKEMQSEYGCGRVQEQYKTFHRAAEQQVPCCLFVREEKEICRRLIELGSKFPDEIVPRGCGHLELLHRAVLDNLARRMKIGVSAQTKAPSAGPEENYDLILAPEDGNRSRRILVAKGAVLCIFDQMVISGIPEVVSAWEDIKLSYGHPAVINFQRAVQEAFGLGREFNALNGTEQAICRRLTELVAANVNIMALRLCRHTFTEHMVALAELDDYFSRSVEPISDGELALTPFDREFLSGLKVTV